eukprot:TRINITY_DN6376_c0_g1_i1.p1 TRINITY_DN6376_c0_g1~~TRINITY_DN6376_c0_g1_i1.p1  ORF type:complete len:110 (-),score=8.60 TRINITY_DN6376_c0_g1_i1:18-347(-)
MENAQIVIKPSNYTEIVAGEMIITRSHIPSVCINCPKCETKLCSRCFGPVKQGALCVHCNTSEHERKILLTCEDKWINGQLVPKIRRCVACSAFIEHAAGCKHMMCKFC